MTSTPTIRNISIIAHIDHGKTTLTDRLMLATNTISEREFRDQLLDSNPIEQERGITIKLAPVTLQYSKSNIQYSINLIDTPGHVDFGYEVERSLAACEGALLLVDATQGIQAQTLSNLGKAKKLGLKIIAVLNKIDLPAADTDSVSLDIIETLGIPEQDIIPISAKTGQNIDQIFEAIISKIPPPSVNTKLPTRALVFNSIYHPHKGIVAFIKAVDGHINTQELTFMSSGHTFTPLEVGIFTPEMTPGESISSGQVGYVATGFKDPSFVKAGDTITSFPIVPDLKPLPGYKEPLPTVYLDLYPAEGKDFPLLKDGIEKLVLSDSSLQYSLASSKALGKGYRIGFLGALHAEIVIERLKREHNLDLIPTAPTVVYKVTTTSGENLEIKNPSDLPDPSLIDSISEPVANVTIFTPEQYLGGIMQLSSDHRGELVNQSYLGSRIKLEYLIPLSELIINFFDRLKSVSSGYASLEYEIFDYQPVDAIKLSILVNKEPIEALSQIVVRSKSIPLGKHIVSKLKDAIPRQNFLIPVQAAIGGTIIARESIKAFRKDVTAKLYGGDISRRKKLLEKQKKGKAKRSQFAKVDIPQSAYLSVLKQ